MSANQSFTLTTIRFSHFNEKARWGLDYYELPYKEFPLMPVIHFPFALWASRMQGKRDKVSTRFSTPILRTPQGKILTDSSAILHYLSETYGTAENSLFPNEEAVQLERYWSDELAPHARRVAYFHGLPSDRLLHLLADHNVPRWQARAFKCLLPFCRGTIQKAFHINPETAERSRGKILAAWQKAEDLLADGRRFLTAGRFTAADLAFACSAAPALLISPEEGYGGLLPPLGMTGREGKDLALQLRATKAGDFVLRMFREHHGKRIIPCHPIPKSPMGA